MKNIIIAIIALGVVRCVPVPTAPAVTTTPLTEGGVFVVCEGLWRQNNATLSYVTPSGAAERDVVSTRNADLRLGDTGSDILIHGDSVYVCASSSGSIEVFHRKTGTWQGRILFDRGREPYKLSLLNDTSAVCSILNDDCIAEIHLRNLSVRVAKAPTGPAPEGLCVMDNKIYVANSGLGDLRSKEEGAGTVSILDARDLRIVNTIPGLPNVMSCTADPQRNRVWIVYRHLASQPDSLGGVVLYDPTANTIIDHQRYNSPKGLVVDPQTGRIYILHRAGIDAYDHTTRTTTPLIQHVSGNGNDVWYSLGWWTQQNILLVGNARSYVTDGEVIAIDLNGAIRFRTGVGLNPSAFGD